MGVSCFLPPKGMSTVPAPMVLSKRSDSPRLEHTLRSPASARIPSTKLFGVFASRFAGATILAVVCFSAPLEFKNSREMSTMVLPFHFIRRRGSSVTTATTVASRFSAYASRLNFSAFSAATTTAILSCDSLIASSVPSRPSYFLGTALRSISRPSASSPIATDTPPAPKSLHLFMSSEASGLRKSLWSLRSSGALPFCTSAPQVAREAFVCRNRRHDTLRP